jgi:sugar/nucleoside kinase (ribokinase family)
MKNTELVNRLRESEFDKWKIVIMPHFCIDNLIHYGGDYESFEQNAKEIAKQGGGNISVTQSQQVGGKAANCANTLSALGVPSFLIARTSGVGHIILKHFFSGKDVDISHVKPDGELAITSSIELDSANIMLSDSGSLSEFGPRCLTEEDEKLITEADLVCISDWGLNNQGTELASHVFKLVKENGKGKTFFDPGDPSPKGEEIGDEARRMIKEVLGEGLVDILSLNLAEAVTFGGIDFLRTMARLDLHTEEYARTYFGFRETEKQPAFSVSPLRLTGAGDAWNAGDILGELMNLPDDLRLTLAHATAAFYISDPQGKHPSLPELIKFIESQEMRQ